MPLKGHAAFRSLVGVALLAGIATGVVSTGVQQITTLPLILQAEVHERSVTVTPQQPLPGNAANAASPASHDARQQGPSAHDHEPHEPHTSWAPREGFERTAYTGLTTILAAFAYALILGAALSLTRTAGLRAGVVLGAAGFVVFQLAPAFGLPPEPPGVPQADLWARQAWWLGTVLCTALALWCGYSARTPSKGPWRLRGLWGLAGVALLGLPHVIGAPQAPALPTLVPTELVHRFALLALVTTALFWLMLGALVGLLHGRDTVRAVQAGKLHSA